MSTTRKTSTKSADSVNEAASTAQNFMNDGLERMTQGMSNVGAFGQENVEAMIESATTMAKGFEKIANENVEYAKKQMETGSDRFQSLTKARTPQEFFEAQSELLRNSMETQIGQVNKMSDMMIATARDAAQPLSKRYTAFIEMVQQSR
ncbi:hypothetical protein PB2503_10319 [Parvularcula bermudensis HTCC2503]|uniref:Phasin domain-containing protein n=1 Tax=Parvularcula bermudensis (strain ATCC BAA-594 / HTCC2503 / KCTC 12087) TaxID=314260 RepID=E0TFZ6_PARBH|nr:phasin family protein [Parvularcula bermudensis]ADM10115.1 hypothetical protein PB2503_10319 [Parvularcula bermudensis HTCC2503]